ncbi:NUDIX hydrolase [Salipaludibacillus sp. HK11]|uniref:NUDIX hydrolase n=1 Tax=Salipaludibacillus sp. HK11 TaxID=3394320 RepID=UPI0039FD2626
MQRVTNCILTKSNEALLLRKPSRGWWVAPGGKMESRESIRESVIRECKEETGMVINNPELRGVFTVVIEEKGSIVKEWMMFTFQANNFSGKLLNKSPEGELAWTPITKIPHLPMASGDYPIFDHVLYGEGLIYGTITYDENLNLLSYRLDTAGEQFQE